MSLKTDYKSDVLASTNTQRHYKVMNGSTVVHADVTLTDITSYSQEGDNFGAGDINSTNTEVNKLIDANTPIKSTVSSGATSVTFSNSRIKTTSLIQPFMQISAGVATEPFAYNTIKVETGKVTMTFDAVTSSTTFGIFIREI